MRRFSIVMGILLLIGAVLQYDYPDPARWALIYLAAAALSFQAALRSPPPWGLPVGIGLVAAMWAGALATRVGAPAYPQIFRFVVASIEVREAREVLGLAGTAIWMGVLARWSFTHRH